MPEELGRLLNALLEAERAGAKALAAFASERHVSSPVRAELLRIQRDESANCVALLRLLRRNGTPATRATGTFLRKALAIEGLRPRLEFLNRGQRWVERRIDEALPVITDPEAEAVLREMRDSHAANIAACEALLADQRDSIGT